MRKNNHYFMGRSPIIGKSKLEWIYSTIITHSGYAWDLALTLSEYLHIPAPSPIEDWMEEVSDRGYSIQKVQSMLDMGEVEPESVADCVVIDEDNDAIHVLSFESYVERYIDPMLAATYIVSTGDCMNIQEFEDILSDKSLPDFPWSQPAPKNE